MAEINYLYDQEPLFDNKYEGNLKIEKRYEDIETGEVKYEFKIGESVTLKLALSEINSTHSVLKLAKYGVPIVQEDAKELLMYIKDTIEANQFETVKSTKRIGFVKNQYVHPFDSSLEIDADDLGEADYIEKFKKAGTMASWRDNVFAHFKENPEVIFSIVSSFASVMLQHFKADSFIVEVYGLTSTGKSTTLKASASVWGSIEMINEWNTTLVAFERNVAYANIYPVLIDDTKKANSSIVEKMVYTFSGGKSKGRGNAKGLQEVRTWNNILLSTGEYSILNFTKGAGGAAARCISLELKSNNNDQHFFKKVYKGFNENYGAAGYAFLKHWRKLVAEKGEDLDNNLDEIISELTADTSNQVAIRLARSFAIVILAAEILNDKFNFNIDIPSFYNLFKKLQAENSQIDLPLDQLKGLLDTIDSERGFGKKYYLSKTGDVLLPVQYLNVYLGNNSSIIRQMWLERGFTEGVLDKATGKTIDYKKRHTVDVVNNTSHKRNTVAIKKEIINELGYDYQI